MSNELKQKTLKINEVEGLGVVPPVLEPFKYIPDYQPFKASFIHLLYSLEVQLVPPEVQKLLKQKKFIVYPLSDLVFRLILYI